MAAAAAWDEMGNVDTADHQHLHSASAYVPLPPTVTVRPNAPGATADVLVTACCVDCSAIDIDHSPPLCVCFVMV